MFRWFSNLLTKMSRRRKAQDAWSETYTNRAGGTKNNLPLDPSNDPWVS